jgi:endoglucanase
VRDCLIQWASPFADELYTDALGSLHVLRRGAKHDRTLLLAAHMDEVGLMVRSVTDEGLLRFDAVGGLDRRVLLGKTVWLNGTVPGVIGSNPKHLLGKDESKRVPELKELRIDLGCADKAQAQALANIGDPVYFDGESYEFGDGFLKSKALDDRCGCAVLSLLLELDLPQDTWFVFTVQEEVGLRGGHAARYAHNPDAVLIVEATSAADLPDAKGPRRVCVPGGGPVLPYADGGTIYDPGLFARLRALAEQNGIPWQTKELIAGGTDGAAFQRSLTAVPTAALSVATRYIHSPASVLKLSDLDALHTLAKAFVLNF